MKTEKEIQLRIKEWEDVLTKLTFDEDRREVAAQIKVLEWVLEK